MEAAVKATEWYRMENNKTDPILGQQWTPVYPVMTSVTGVI